jgi:hypothetical protein
MAAPPPAKPRPPAEPLIADLLLRLRKVADCPASKRVYCLATEGWSAATAADLPARGVLAGLTIGLERDKPDAELLETEVSLSAFAVKDGRGLITDIPPENAAEKKTIAAAVTALGKALRGGPRAELAPSLVRYLGTLPDGAAYPLSRDGASWRMIGKAEAWVRRLPGGAWIAVEVPPEGPIGIFISIYPDAWLAR